MHLTRTQIIIIGVVLVIIIGIGLLVAGILPGLRSKAPTAQIAGKLLIWGVANPHPITDALIADYKKLRPGVEVSYTQMSEDSYEEDLLNALAAGNGPDIIMFKNTWLPKHFDKIYPLAAAQFPTEQFQSLYPSVVEQNFTANGNVYALPLSIDTLVMFYNKDIFDNEAVAQPPKTWEQFINLVPRLRKLDPTNKILRAAAAIGGSNKTITHASDLLSLLMLQSSVPMTDSAFTSATFAAQGEPPLRFYTSFANSGNQNYTWNDSLPNSLDAFSQETSAVIFDYGSQIEVLKAKNPFLNFGVAPMLQPVDTKKDINYSSYWGLAVSNKSKSVPLAWDFILTTLTSPTVMQDYLNASHEFPALRSLIAQMANQPQIGIFAKQALTAKAWPQVDARLVDTTFNAMIQSVISGQSAPDKALQTAQEAISQVMRKKNAQ